MSDAARHSAHFVREEVYGVLPAAPEFTRLRHTSMTLGVQRGSLQSAELRPDRQIANFKLGAVMVAGDIGAELSFGSFDALLEAVTLGTWGAKASKTATTLSIATADDSLNDSANGFIVAGFEVGDIIILSGFTGTPANNGTFLITSVAAGKLILQNPDATAAVFVDDAAGESVTVATNELILRAGTERRSFSILRHFTDIEATGEGEPYHLFTGCEFNTLALSVNPTAMITATFGVIGREGVAPANEPPEDADFEDAPETEPLDAFTGEMLSDGVPVGNITEITLNLANGLAVRNVIGSKLTIRPSIGKSNLTGSFTAFFDDSVFLKKFINETPALISFELPDDVGNSYVFEIPRVNFTGGQPDVSGEGSISLSLPFQGTYDPTAGSNIIIRKIPALV